MKRVVALLLSGVMLTSLVLCGCTPKETEETVQSGSQEETTEAGFEAPVNTLNEKKLKKAQEYCVSVDPEGDEGIPVFIDGIRGSGSTMVDDKLVHFNYQSLDGDNLDINVHRDTGEVSFSIDMKYRDECYAADASFYLGGFEEFFDKVCADPASVEPYNKSALNTNLDDLKNDFPIIFSRIIAFTDVAFSEAGLGFRDLGIDFGDKYRAIDPKQRTSKEVEITNEHQFENGICTDCGITWVEYYCGLVFKFAKPVVNLGKISIPGQKSPSMLSPVDEVTYFEDSGCNAGMCYHHVETDNDAGIKKDDYCNIYINHYDSTEIEIQYWYRQQKFSTGGKCYTYYVIIQTKPGELDKVFESKESLKNHLKDCTLAINPEGKRIESVYDVNKFAEEQVGPMMEADGLTFLTKDEIIDRFWDLRSTFFTSLDNGMIWMKTSLKDFGFNWK